MYNKAQAIKIETEKRGLTENENWGMHFVDLIVANNGEGKKREQQRERQEEEGF